MEPRGEAWKTPWLGCVLLLGAAASSAAPSQVLAGVRAELGGPDPDAEWRPARGGPLAAGEPPAVILSFWFGLLT
jgi:hypothetical protein